MRCSACGTDNPARAKFCLGCGAALAVLQPRLTEERKVVSVLFCDLVGFTAASDHADPEDVRARLVPYEAMLRRRVESFGGTVEKFIGDAVMAVFGYPIAHEDDAERAVRAGLAILDAVEDLNAADASVDISVRVGINTGEAVVVLGARPAAGDGFVAGDVVNTAARIQSAAPVGAVAVGEATYAATSRVFCFERLEPVTVKGKSAPVDLWRAGPPRARFGVDVLRSMDTPLVGRALELLQLQTAFDRAARESSVQLVTVTGEPGIGKSRLVAELFAYTDSLPDLVTWRQGRCLPYGDGITFWALGEIVKAHAGVLDSDGPAETAAKLEKVLPAEEDAAWWRSRLLPLLGVDTGVSVSREESFTAWRRFLESLAAAGPTVLVVEDLHWADEALLAFLEHLAGWAHGVPMLVVTTARPELYETHPHWAAGLRNNTMIALTGLSEADMAALVIQLLGRQPFPAQVQRLVLDRAEGNPLYAEECVRVLQDRGLLDGSGDLLGQGEGPFPAGIRALIAARLDTLSPDRKALLADAAVVGRVFWAASLTAVGGHDPAEVSTALHELITKEFIRPARHSSLAGQAELAFWHALVRDVAYGSIPRPSRAAKHLAAAHWLEAEAAGRIENSAAMLAHHTGQALALARAAGDTALAARITPLARRHALLAAERVAGLDADQAMQLFERALELTSRDDPDHPSMLLRWAEAAHHIGRTQAAADAAEIAATEFTACGDVVGAATALAELASTRFQLGHPDAGVSIRRAVSLLDSQPPGPELIDALAHLASYLMVSAAFAESITVANRALALAHELGRPVAARALATRGSSRCALGDRAGLADYGKAIPLHVSAGQAHDAAIAYNNLGVDRWAFDGPVAALAAYDDGLAFAMGRGLVGSAQNLRISRLQPLLETGRFDEALREADALLQPELRATSGYFLVEVRAVRARLLLERGQSDDGTAELALADARRIGTPDVLVSAGLSATQSLLHRCDLPGAGAVIAHLLSVAGLADSAEYAPRLVALVRCALAAGNRDLAHRLTNACHPDLPVRGHARAGAGALLAQAAGEHTRAVAGLTDAAARWAAFGNRLEQAYALLALGHSLLAQGSSADQPLREAGKIFAGMGARPGARECEALLTPAAGTATGSPRP